LDEEEVEEVEEVETLNEEAGISVPSRSFVVTGMNAEK